MRFHFSFVIVVMSLLSISCDTIVNVEIPFEGEKLVLNGILSNSNVISIRISKTISAIPQIPIEDLIIDNATVVLFENGVEVELLDFQNGSYLSSTGRIPIPGNWYQIQAQADGFDNIITEEVLIPYEWEMVITDVQTIESSNNPDEPALKVEYVIIDSVATKDYYAIEIQGYVTELNSFQYANRFIPESNLDISSNCVFITDNFDVFDDLCFDGTYNSFIEAELDYRDSIEYSFEFINITFHRVDQSFFDYLRTESQNLDGIEFAFLEPQFNYSNVNGGYGILVATNSITQTILND